MSGLIKSDIIKVTQDGPYLLFHFNNGFVSKIRASSCHFPKAKEPFAPTQEWEAKCNGCGDCCEYRYVDHYGDIVLTSLYCVHFNKETRRCNVYYERHTIEDGCGPITPDMDLSGLPKHCGYRDAD